MFQPNGFLALLDSRSFGTVWFWLLLTIGWTLAGRRVLGVPMDVIMQARRAGVRTADASADADAVTALALLDWLSLTLPRWRIVRRDGAVLTGVAAFLLASLAVLGFAYGLEMAQAIVLLTIPFGLVFLSELRLAPRVWGLLEQARLGQRSANEIAAEAARLMRRHRLLTILLSFLAVAVTAFYGAIWMLIHPFGI